MSVIKNSVLTHEGFMLIFLFKSYLPGMLVMYMQVIWCLYLQTLLKPSIKLFIFAFIMTGSTTGIIAKLYLRMFVTCETAQLIGLEAQY